MEKTNEIILSLEKKVKDMMNEFIVHHHSCDKGELLRDCGCEPSWHECSPEDAWRVSSDTYDDLEKVLEKIEELKCSLKPAE